MLRKLLIVILTILLLTNLLYLSNLSFAEYEFNDLSYWVSKVSSYRYWWVVSWESGNDVMYSARGSNSKFYVQNNEVKCTGSHFLWNMQGHEGTEMPIHSVVAYWDSIKNQVVKVEEISQGMKFDLELDKIEYEPLDDLKPKYQILIDSFKSRAKMRGNAVVMYKYIVDDISYTQYFETKVFKNLVTGSNEPSMKYQIFSGDNSSKKYHVFWSYVSRMDWNGVVHDNDYVSNPFNPVGDNREFVHVEEGSQPNEPISNPQDKTPDEDFNLDIEPNEFIDVYMVNKVPFGDDEYIEMDAYNLNIIDMGKALSHQRMKQYEFKVDFRVSSPITIEQVKLDGEPLTSSSNFECNTAGQGSFTFKRYLTRDLSTNVSIELPTMEYDWDFILRDSHSVNTPLPDDYEEKAWYDKLLWHIDNMFGAIQKVFGMIPVLIGGVGTAVKTLFSFLPPEWNALILIGIGAGVIKAIKG